MTKNNNSLKRVESSFEEVKTSSKEANKTMEKNNVIVTEIKLRQANELEAREDVLVVEEDFTVAASGELDMDDNVIRNVINNPVRENNEDNRDTNVENNSDTEWNIDMIKAKYGDNMNVTNKVKVAILDSGIEYSNRLNVVKRQSFIPGMEEGNEIFEDISGHGTSVAGVLAAKSLEGSVLKGVNSNVEIYSATVLDEENKAPISRIIAGIYWAIENDVNILSISVAPHRSISPFLRYR
jgi:minor extracellular protease Epr